MRTGNRTAGERVPRTRRSVGHLRSLAVSQAVATSGSDWHRGISQADDGSPGACTPCAPPRCRRESIRSRWASVVTAATARAARCPAFATRRLGVRIPLAPQCDVSGHRWQVSRDIVAFLGCVSASRLGMVAPSSPGSRPGPCGWPAASLDPGCGGAVWPGSGCRRGVAAVCFGWSGW